MSKITLEGKLNLTNLKDFDSEHYTTRYASIMYSAYVGKGKGYQGGNYENDFMSISYNLNNSNRSFGHGNYVRVSGDVGKTIASDGRTFMKIWVKTMEAFSPDFTDKSVKNANAVHNVPEPKYDDNNLETQEDIDNDAILFED